MEQLKYTTALPLHYMPGAAGSTATNASPSTSSKRASKSKRAASRQV
jgi:hypothetical protein